MNTENASYKRKALVVEDNEMNREVLAALLSDEYDVLTAENGQVGLDILAEHYRELSVIFLDVVMPVCNGYEFLERIQHDALLGAVPVIVTTGNDNPEEEAKCIDLGASDFVSKPYNARVVLGRARSLIKLRESVATLSAVEFDDVTGYYTMPAFYHHANRLLCELDGVSYDLIASDIPEFKLVNSVYGEKAGDEVLKFIADSFNDRIENSLIARQGDKIFCLYPSQYRLSSEEFVDSIESAIKNAPVANLPIKCGCYKDVDKEQNINILCDRVLMAVAGIKHDMTRSVAYYDDEVRMKRVVNQKMESDFDEAIANKEFVVWYQPKVDIESEELIAAEALVRWIDKNGNMISPGAFIPLFEMDGLIHRLDEYVFNSVCEFQKKRIQEGKKVVPISVNLSRSSVHHKGTIDKYVGMVTQAGISTELVPIELTESAATEGQRIRKLADDLVKEGFFLHMDDFGSGYSSLSSLGTIPFDVLKLDKSLVDQIGTGRGDVIIKHTIMIAQELGMRVVAEGVENEVQLNFLRGSGCDMIQGYYYSPPKNQDDFVSLLDGDGFKKKK